MNPPSPKSYGGQARIDTNNLKGEKDENYKNVNKFGSDFGHDYPPVGDK
jgi:hypothetical protein